MKCQMLCLHVGGAGGFHFACKSLRCVDQVTYFCRCYRLCYHSFAPNLALGGNQAPRTPLKVVRGTPKEQNPQISHFCWDPFWRHFSIISDVFFVRFFDALQDGHFSDVGAKLGPRRVLLGDVFTTFWAQAEPMKIMLSCGFWLGSEGWRLSQIDEFSEVFRVCL